jgi:hypothetical protein
MTQLPTELKNATRTNKLLILWGDMRLDLSEHEPTNRALVINRWLGKAQDLSAIDLPLSRLPPVPILSLDPTDRIEGHFQQARTVLRVVGSTHDVPTVHEHTLIKLAGDLASRARIVLSREAVRSLHSDADKRYLLDLAQRIAANGVVLLIGCDPSHANFKAWWSILAPLFIDAKCFALGDPELTWPARVTCLGLDAHSILSELSRSIAVPSWPKAKPPSPMLPSPETNRSGGVDVSSSQTTINGDVAGRDKIVINIQHVDHLSPEMLAEGTREVKQPIEVQTLRVDAAVPERVTVQDPFDLAVAVRQTTSPVLTAQDLPQVASGDVQVIWPEHAPFIRLRIEVDAPECDIADKASRSFRLLPGKDSPVFYFHLTPKHSGDLSIFVTVYQEDDGLGSARLHTIAFDQPLAGQVQVTVTSQPLSSANPDRVSVQRQLDSARENLRLIEERKAEYVLEVDIPMQLIKEERKLKERIAELEQKLSP